MGIFSKQPAITEADDATLVLLTLGGDRQAFSQIVSRYQNLLCSLAYSAVGDIKHSEDIAQDTFVDAWKKLDSLREPHKLKSWLCGILRFKVSHYRRKEVNQPVAGADELDEQGATGHNSTQLEEDAIRDQQQALLWRTLDGLDDTYRETLVLYYREQQSIEQVAAELDLTTDTAKQRLSRGRKLLQKAMTTFVEEALENTKPGAGFTAAVLTAISGIAPPSKAAVIGAGAVKTGSFFSLASIITLLATFSGLISAFFGLRASLDQARTPRERQQTIKMVAQFLIVAAAFVVGMFTLRHFALTPGANALLYTTASQLLVLVFVITYLWLSLQMIVHMRDLRAEERQINPQAFSHPIDQVGSTQRESKSRLTLLGIPLYHVRFGMAEADDRPVIGWFAGGDRAIGLLFAWGGIAAAPISVGIASIGIVSIGAVGAGVVGLGTVGIGLVAFGASAIAYKAYGSLSALGWESAFSNGFSVAVDAAIGPLAYAAEVNNDAAAEMTQMTLWGQSYLWVLAVIATMVIAPSAWYARSVRKRMKG